MNPASPGDVVTQRYNNLRTGTTQFGGLDRGLVADQRFGLLKALTVDGVVLAQPLFMEKVLVKGKLRSAVFIATSTNMVYAFDADTLDKLWEQPLGDPYRLTDAFTDANNKEQCGGQMAATEQEGNGEHTTVVLGNESTPVIDFASSRIIVTYRKGGFNVPGEQHIVALHLEDGQPVIDRRVEDNPKWNQVHRNRASLLLDSGHVYVAFSGLCEAPDSVFFNHNFYQGWIYAFDAETLAPAGRYRSTQQPDGTPPIEPTDDNVAGGGIWQASTGLAADGHGNLYFATGNQTGCSDTGDPTVTPVRPPLLKCSPPDAFAKNLADSIVRLRVDPTPSGPPGPISMTPADWFTPYRKTWLDWQDLDFAAAGVVLIPNTRYLVAGGKEGMLYVLDRDHLGKFDGSVLFDASTVKGHFSGDKVGLDDPERDQVVQKFQAAESRYCRDRPGPLFCGGAPPPGASGVTMTNWPPWAHIHGTPVFGAFPDGRAFLYLWAEKDFLKSFQWWGRRFDTTPTAIATNKAGEKVLTPPYLSVGPPGGAIGMPGGMLALTIDPSQPAKGVLFASVQRCRVRKAAPPPFDVNKGDPGFHECSISDTAALPCQIATDDLANCGDQAFGMLRAFDPITLGELWNNQSDRFASDMDKNYFFAKFVPPTIAHGRVFLPTGSRKVLVYGQPLDQIRFVISTGDDDLRNNHLGGCGGTGLTADVLLQDGTSFSLTLKPTGTDEKWDNNTTTRPLDFQIPSGVPLTRIKGITLTIHEDFEGPCDPDNWDMTALNVSLFNAPFNSATAVSQLALTGNCTLQDGHIGLTRFSERPDSSGVGPTATFLVSPGFVCPP